MRIGGFQPFTLSDFPGRTAAIIFTKGCDFRCPFCHNGSLIDTSPSQEVLTDGGPTDESTVLHFLEQRRGKLNGVVVTGGEPTLQEDLPEFLNSVKALGYAVKLDTNGGHPDVLTQLIEHNLIDYAAMDIKAPFAYYNRLTGVDIDVRLIRKSIRIIADSELPHHFRTTEVKALFETDYREAVEQLVPPGSTHVWQVFQPLESMDLPLRSLD